MSRHKTEIDMRNPRTFLSRTLEEGYGTDAWHGPDLQGAIGDVTAEAAFRRPAPARHNIAEVALHHAWYVRSVTGRLSGEVPRSFPLDGEDWFDLNADGPLSWDQVKAELAERQHALGRTVGAVGDGKGSPLSDAQQFDLVLGITCHAVYHAGQIQLIKRLLSSS